MSDCTIQKRSLAKCIILSLVTFGIYGIVWMIGIVNDLNKVSGNPNDKSGGMVILLTIITCSIYGWLWLYKSGEKVVAARKACGKDEGSNPGTMYLILALLGLSFVSFIMIQNELNQLAE